MQYINCLCGNCKYHSDDDTCMCLSITLDWEFGVSGAYPTCIDYEPYEDAENEIN